MGFSESDVIDALRVSGNKEGDAVSALAVQFVVCVSLFEYVKKY